MRQRVRAAARIAGAPLRGALLVSIETFRLLTSGLAPRCRYYPSCSSYAEQAVRVHGALRGSLLACWRLLRCNPLSRGGVDHVPRARASLYERVIRGGSAR